MVYYSYSEFINDIKGILPSLSYNNFDAVISVARGGSTLGHFVSEALNIRNLYSINSILYDDTKKLDEVTISNIPDLTEEKKILIVDDICDSGETMKAITELLNNKYPKTTFKTMTIFYKSSAVYIPDFKIREATDWIEFFWSCDLK